MRFPLPTSLELPLETYTPPAPDALGETAGGRRSTRALGSLLPFSRARDLGVHGRERLFGGLAIAEVGIALAIPAAGGSLSEPYDFALLTASSIAAFTFAGLVWWRARPSSRTGPLLCALGLMYGLVAFQGAAGGTAHGVGVLAEAPLVVVVWYLIAAFPEGRLTTWGRGLVGVLGVAMAAAFLPWLLLSPRIVGAGPLASCAGACPRNALQIAHNPTAAAGFRHVEEWAVAISGVLLVGTLVVRFVRAGRARRRVLAPVYAASVLWLLALGAYHGAHRAGLSRDVIDALGLWQTMSRLLFPIACVAAIVLARAYAGARLQPLLRDLMRHAPVQSFEALVARALGDPSARLAFWLTRSSRWVDASGWPVERPQAGSGLSWHAFAGSDDEPLIAILHDAVLDEDPELVEVAGAATVLAVENRRLDRNLRRSTHDLRASQQRLVAAVTDERRKIEQELHDGSQQRLLSIGIELELVREHAQADPETLERLGGLGEAVDEALQELRSVAHGTYPPLLAVLGLETALRELAGRSGVPVAMDVAEVPRLAPGVEAAVYFTCLEALQNVLKHAGRAARVRVRLVVEQGELRFAIADDGDGFTPGPGRPGSGLQSMADRVGAVGGRFSVTSAPGHGTVVAGEIPVGES